MKKDYFCFDRKKWFFETDLPYEDVQVKTGIEIKKKLYSGKSPFQKIAVFDTYKFKKILVLDGILQTSEADEFIYHEMICHMPLFLHRNPRNVLIVGGGDGGSLEEVLKHGIKEVQMVEIDKKVVDVSKKYLSSVSKGAFRNKKAKLIIGDGKEHVKRHRNYFDVIILDLSDPTGPAEQLISLEFYRAVKGALKKDGIVSIQSGSFSAQPRLVSTIFKRVKKVFTSCYVHRMVIYSYQGGEFTLTIGAKTDISRITKKELEKRFKKAKIKLKYYSPEIYFSSRVLPGYIKKELALIR
jgi:spermidine synthase